MIETLSQVADVYHTGNLRSVDAEVIMRTYAAGARTHFAGVYQGEWEPLLIPAHNEQEDLAATLLAAAKNTNLMPVVLNNRSSDRTSSVARRMGAIVIEVPTGGKVAATQTGLELARDEGKSNVYLTDADTLVMPHWSRGMRRALETADKGHGSAVFGNSILWYGESLTADVVLSAAKIGRAVMRQLTNGPVVPRGHNYAVRLDPEGKVLAAVNSLDPNMRAGNDRAICDVIAATEAAVIGVSSLQTMVITRNDKVGSLWQRLQPSYGKRRNQVYAEQYHSDEPPTPRREA